MGRLRQAAGRGEGSGVIARCPTVRFAPSPNGLLHLGHAYSALMNDRLARRGSGRFLLRIEDIDRPRCREDYVAAIEQDLDWLGLDWEKPVRRQSRHFPIYAAALDGLARRELAYPCFCTRNRLAAAVAERGPWPKDPDGVALYPGLCRDLPPAERSRRVVAGQSYAWRLDMRAALAWRPTDLGWEEWDDETEAVRRVVADAALWGDAIIARKDIPTSYHLAVVIDDAAQAVTDVVRGRDLFAATGLQRLLQGLLDLPVPRYHHHRLILDEAGRKLAKSRHSSSLRSLRESGATPASIRRRLGLA